MDRTQSKGPWRCALGRRRSAVAALSSRIREWLEELRLKDRYPREPTRAQAGRPLCTTRDQDAVRDAFSRFGEVADAHLVTDRQTGQARGFGFVTMGTIGAAPAAITGMNGSNLDGRELRFNDAEERQGGGGGRNGGFGGGGAGGGKRSRW